jgi:hypothetical protein
MLIYLLRADGSKFVSTHWIVKSSCFKVQVTRLKIYKLFVLQLMKRRLKFSFTTWCWYQLKNDGH